MAWVVSFSSIHLKNASLFEGGSVCRKSLAEFAPAGANKVLTIFSGGVYVGENTSRLANVRAKRVRCGEPQPLQTRAQRSGSRLSVCQKILFWHTLPPSLREVDFGEGKRRRERRFARNAAWAEQSPAPTGMVFVCRKTSRPTPGGKLYPANPFGFLLCQFQLSRHISSRECSAFQPSSRSALPGSQYTSATSPARRGAIL